MAAAGIVMAVATAHGPDFAGGDPVRGERQFQRCFSCHAVDPAEKAKLQGPSLYRIVGRRAGSTEGFEYSDAMRAAGAAGLVWDEARIDAFITDAEAAMPGTKMAMPPLREPDDRADIIAYLIAAGSK